MSIKELRQHSLLNYFADNKSLRGAVKNITSPSYYDPKLSTPLKYKNINLISPEPYSGIIKEGFILKRKYCVSKNFFIAEGLTHSDYTIAWEGFDDHGSGRGKVLVDKNYRINIDMQRLENESNILLEDCLWIGGDTINKPNYAHWMFEHLLKLEIFRLCKIDLSMPIAVSNRIPDAFLYWGDFLIGKRLKWEKVDLSRPVKLKNIHATSCPAFRRKGDLLPAIWISGFQLLRQRLVKLSHCYPQNIFSMSKVLFLSRESGANWRRAVNERELFEIAKQKYNATMISISEYSPIEQIQLIYQAEVLICFGGADGIACNFVNPRCKVLEILAPGHVATYTAQIYCEIQKLRLD